MDGDECNRNRRVLRRRIITRAAEHGCEGVVQE
jgi:hypothetical protein